MVHPSPSAQRPAATQDATPPAAASQKPDVAYRYGSVSAAVFPTEVKTKDGTRQALQVSLRRSYKDSEGAWQHKSITLWQDDLLPAALALQKCYEFLAEPAAKDDAAD